MVTITSHLSNGIFSAVKFRGNEKNVNVLLIPKSERMGEKKSEVTRPDSFKIFKWNILVIIRLSYQ